VAALFFGPRAQQLYGVLESPSGRARKTGVLLLQPGVHEYMRAHWAFRSLAGALAARGFAVLRFDYRGTGDSAGEPEATTFEACVDDACVAAEELRDAGMVQDLVLIGMRLGAAVALRASAKLPFARRVLLWNPIVTGRAYLEELEQMDRALRLQLLHALHAPERELGGYRFPDAARDSIARVDLREERAARPRRVEIFVESAETPPAIAALASSLVRSGHTVKSHRVSSSEPAAFPDAALLAQEAIRTLVARAEAAE
jgi:alpha-beta hydrolase superfamily lysophospholipase